MNAFDTFRLMHAYSKPFYILKGGLSQLVHRLLAKLKHVEFRKENVKNVQYNNNQFIVSAESGLTFQAPICVAAMPRSALEKLTIFKPLKPTLAHIKTSPLCRIYSVVSDGVLTKKISTDNDLRFVIPVTKNVALVSYTDGKYADRWKRVHDAGGVKEVNKKLHADLAEIGVNTSVKHTKVFYWPEGVGYWGVGADSIAIENQVLQPFRIPLFVCGENYSYAHQQWMEGALETSEKVVYKIQQLL